MQRKDVKRDEENISRHVSRFCVSARPRAPLKRARRHAGYTLIEFFVTVAVLVIVLGLMVDLSNRVRRSSADRRTRQMLAHLTTLMQRYADRNAGRLPVVYPLIDPTGATDEHTLQARARQNNIDFVKCLRSEAVAVAAAHAQVHTEPLFPDLPLSLYDEVELHDPWGTPIVFMPGQSPIIGMAPGDRFFFVSAGPDRQFLTREDDLFSYEESE